VDLAPTFFEVAGAVAPDSHRLDGESLVELMKTGRGLAGRPIYQYSPFYDLRWGLTPTASIRRGDYKLIEFFGDRVDDDGLYIPGRHVELYNLRNDIGETTNLTKSQPKLAAELQEALRAWAAEIGAPMPQENSHYEPDRAFTETRDKPPWLQD
jgi:arylsulfatase A-like enzyme